MAECVDRVGDFPNILGQPRNTSLVTFWRRSIFKGAKLFLRFLVLLYINVTSPWILLFKVAKVLVRRVPLKTLIIAPQLRLDRTYSELRCVQRSTQNGPHFPGGGAVTVLPIGQVQHIFFAWVTLLNTVLWADRVKLPRRTLYR